MDIGALSTQLANNASSIAGLSRWVSDDQARWKPDAQSWSVLEVINHLYDEERKDFRLRLEYILFRPGQPWEPINPQGWVIERGYNQRDLKESVDNFLLEREKSLDWLKGLGAPDWDTLCVTPFGQMTAGDMFAAWVGHDLLHLRQLVELHWAYTNRKVKPYSTAYAGEW